MRTIAYALSVICLSGALAPTASAQTDVRPGEWSHGTALSGFAGVSTDSAHTGPLLGGAVGWEVTSRLAIEGNGAWAEFGDGTGAFSGAMKMRVRITGRRTVDPFVQAGVGLYRARFGANETKIPTFYRNRMTDPFAPEGTATTFTDPTIVGGGGINFFVNRHFALRPDVEAAIIIRNRQHHVVTTVAFHAVFHFENHPVTPFRR
jgi:hypothetical protein